MITVLNRDFVQTFDDVHNEFVDKCYIAEVVDPKAETCRVIAIGDSGDTFTEQVRDIKSRGLAPYVGSNFRRGIRYVRTKV